jgi:RNA polymerase sigma-70 factor (ECF subfamily)
LQPEALDPDLSRITTLWAVVCQANDGAAEEVSAAQKQLVQTYGKAVYRYLFGALRDPEGAEELAQEFALRFVRGEFRGADPKKGRFRDFVKGVLFHLVADYHRKRRRGQPQPLPADDLGPAAEASQTHDSDRRFLESWRDELLQCAWDGLDQIERHTGQPFYTVLRFRADHPDLNSNLLAEQLSPKLGKPLTAAGVRQTLHRAREKFVDLVIQHVAHSLVNPTADDLEQELLDLGLLEYCRPGLARFR